MALGDETGARRGRAWRLARRPYRWLEHRARRSPRLQRLVRTVGAATRVRETMRFSLREAGRRDRVGSYRLRGSGLRVLIRQPLTDMFALEELFRMRAYELPPEVRAGLASLGRPPRILDLGANVGLFTLFTLGELDRAEITSYEPNPEPFSIMERCRDQNSLQTAWRLVPEFAATEDGTVDFIPAHLLGRSASSEAELDTARSRVEELLPFVPRDRFASGEPIEVRARDVLPELATADLAKIDIEGGEWALLHDPRFAKAGPLALTLEIHASEAPTEDFRGAARELLSGAGYRLGDERLAGDDAAVVWAWLDPPEWRERASGLTA